ncbi:MAG: lamin tail domain-containing protein, partial [Bacteroidales bacterium]|nr:lamin tail domain-containing protein [Bacteroidales bacterium]
MIKKIKKIKKIIRKKASKAEPTVANAKSRARPVKKTAKKKTADKLFKQIVIKAVVLLLMIALNWAGLSTIGQTVAYFNDTATSTGNIIQAGTLDFSLSSATDFLPNTINKGESSSRIVNVSNEGILGFQYKVSAAQADGENSLCNGLELVAKLHGITQYTGTLLSLATAPTIFDSASADWLFTISLPSSTADSLQDKSCTFKFIYSGWQTDLAEGAGGFTATEEISVTLNSGHWPITPPPVLSGVVLNEFLPRPENNGPKPDGEWVELYNISATATIDLAGYYLMDNYSGSGTATHKIFVESCRTNTGETTISPHGFLVVYANEGGGSCNSHGFELNNTGDSVR